MVLLLVNPPNSSCIFPRRDVAVPEPIDGQRKKCISFLMVSFLSLNKSD